MDAAARGGAGEAGLRKPRCLGRVAAESRSTPAAQLLPHGTRPLRLSWLLRDITSLPRSSAIPRLPRDRLALEPSSQPCLPRRAPRLLRVPDYPCRQCLSPPFAVARSPPSHMSSPTESPQSHSRSPLTNAPISSPTNIAFSNAPDGRVPEHEQLSVAFVKGGKRKRLSKVCRYLLPTRRVFSYCFRLATHAIRASADAMGRVRTRV